MRIFNYSKDDWQGYLFWFVIGLIILLLFGCASSQQEEYDLLHTDELMAYKSITIKDIKGPKEFN